MYVYRILNMFLINILVYTHGFVLNLGDTQTSAVCMEEEAAAAAINTS